MYPHVMIGGGLRVYKGGQKGNGLGGVLRRGATRYLLPFVKRQAVRVGRKLLNKGYRAVSNRLKRMSGQTGKGFGVRKRRTARKRRGSYKRKRSSYLLS